MTDVKGMRVRIAQERIPELLAEMERTGKTAGNIVERALAEHFATERIKAALAAGKPVTIDLVRDLAKSMTP